MYEVARHDREQVFAAFAKAPFQSLEEMSVCLNMNTAMGAQRGVEPFGVLRTLRSAPWVRAACFKELWFRLANANRVERDQCAKAAKQDPWLAQLVGEGKLVLDLDE